jgi:CubicO group peptidase (beta-lactamase class C family)
MRKNFTAILIAYSCLFFIFFRPVFAQNRTNDERLKGFDEFVQERMKEWNVPGTAVAIICKGEVIFAKGFGYRDESGKLPVTAQTLFAIGSCTKAFTSASVCILVDQGKIGMDKPVIDYIPDFRMYDDYVTLNMTPRDLMTHRSGLPRHDLVWYGSDLSRQQLFDRLRYLEPSKPFRTVFQYQNLMFMTAGYLVEQVSGVLWEQFVKENIFTPLEMKSTNFSVNESQQSTDYSKPYDETMEGKIKEIPFRKIDAMGPAGSINSNITDMSNWVIMQLNNGKFKDKQAISESSIKEMHTPFMVVPSAPNKDVYYTSYGLGWFITSYRGHIRVEHGGNIDGFSADVCLMPDDSVGLVVLTNMNNTQLTSVIRNDIIDRMLDMTEIDWNSKLLADRKLMLEGMKKSKEAVEDNPGKDSEPSHPLKDYTGKFEHPAYGIMEIILTDDGLKASFHGLESPLKHYSYDNFEASKDEFQKLKIRFETNLKGTIDKIYAPLEQGIKDIVFTRVVKKTELSGSLLEKYTGDYEISGTVIKISLRGSTLIMTVPGQPDYELVPFKDNEFNLKDLEGFSVRFTVSPDGKVTELASIQPNGTFVAKKK